VNKRNIFRALGFAVILWGLGVVATNNESIASCVPETGMAGVVHKILFSQSATGCGVTFTPPATISCANVGGTCTLNNSLSPGNGVTGKCVNTNPGCSCLTTTPPTY
jgi:hypothetical protein